MVLTKTVFAAVVGLVALTTDAAPLDKRIAQVIADSTQKWVQACTAAGGAEQCGTTSQKAFMTLLAGAGDCDQQNAADDMVDLAKSLKNDAQMISLAQVFAQQPRNSPNKLSVNYCQQEPKNTELKGLFQCQFQGVDPKTFTNNVKVGGAGTIPLGQNAPIDPPGSCKANPQGGIADGSQLVDSTQDPGVGNDAGAGSGSSNSSSGTSNVGASSNATSASNGSGSGDTGSPDDTGSGSGTSSASDCGNSTGSAGTSGADNGSNDTTASATSPAAAASTPDAGASGTAGAAASAGSATSGADGGDAQSDGGSASANGSDASGSSASATASADGAAASGDFKLQNGKDAEALNAKFASLTDSSPCQEGDQACVKNGFAQCVGGKFQTTQCAAGTKCFALPLVNSPGTSIACTTQSDATSRIQATGATSGPTGA